MHCRCKTTIRLTTGKRVIRVVNKLIDPKKKKKKKREMRTCEITTISFSK